MYEDLDLCKHSNIRQVQVCSKLTMEHLNSNFGFKKLDSVYMSFTFIQYTNEVIILLHRKFVFFLQGF